MRAKNRSACRAQDAGFDEVRDVFRGVQVEDRHIGIDRLVACDGD
jgi:hypothetical protein